MGDSIRSAQEGAYFWEKMTKMNFLLSIHSSFSLSVLTSRLYISNGNKKTEF